MPNARPPVPHPGSLVDMLVRCAYRTVYPIWRVYLAVCKRRTQGTQVAVWSGDQLLLIRNSYRKDYSFPGGYVSRGEDTAVAARRELREETGLSVAADQLVFYCAWSNTRGRASDHCSLFECRFAQPPVVTIDNREVIEAQFVTRQQALALPLARHVSDYLSGCR